MNAKWRRRSGYRFDQLFEAIKVLLDPAIHPIFSLRGRRDPMKQGRTQADMSPW